MCGDHDSLANLSSVLEHVCSGKDIVIKEVEGEDFPMVEEKKLMRQDYFVSFVKIRD